MKKVDALSIQKSIRSMGYVTVPWIQVKYHLSYGEAKEFLEELIRRGWVESKPVGIRYAVIGEHLVLRKIKLGEIDGLLDGLTRDSVRVLGEMTRRNDGVTMPELLRVFRREENALAKAIDFLMERKLISRINDRFYMAVSKATVIVLCEAFERWMSAMEVDLEKLRLEIRGMFEALLHDKNFNS